METEKHDLGQGWSITLNGDGSADVVNHTTEKRLQHIHLPLESLTKLREICRPAKAVG